MTTQAEWMGRAVGLAAAAVGLVVGISVGGIPARAAQADGARKSIPPTPTEEVTRAGAAECQECHSNDNPRGSNLYKKTHGYDFVRLWENKVWDAHDLHATAYKNLLTERNKGKSKAPANRTATVMEDNLRKAYGKDDYTVTTDTRCLACHATTVKPVTAAAVAAWTPKDFNVSEGVSCEACHGHGRAYLNKHKEAFDIDGEPAEGDPTQYVPWREADPKAKTAWGLVHLRDPAVATARCASCHVGNLAEGRFVAHEFYAAGHPPLPPLDLLAYTREQPRHWGLASEMPFITALAKRDKAKAWNTFHYKADESAVARRFAESTVATLRANLDLTAQLAADAEKTGGGLDFSAFDCYACHHDLKYPSDRQARGYVGPPGRPLFRPAPFALARVVADHAAGVQGGEALTGRGAALLEVEKELAKAFGAKTFGDPALIKIAVANGTKLSDETLAAVRKLTYDPAARDKLLDAVIAASGRPVADPEVAQLYAWAYETLALDVAGPSASPKDAPQPPPPAVAALHAKLSDIVVTRLRPGAKFTYEVTPTTTHPSPTLQSVDLRLQERMKTFNAFEAGRFRAVFADLSPKK
ncbi:MAG: multiheme c-type cytochrome [Gemmataceae bacterium]